jgi:hypothetical protein
MSVYFRLCFMWYFVVSRVVVVQPWIISLPQRQPQRPQQAATINRCNQLGHHPILNNVPSSASNKNLQVVSSQIDSTTVSKVTSITRRNWIDAIKTGVLLLTAQQLLLNSQVVTAKPDCYTDCYKNCIALAPKDNLYCSESCTDYCLQDDRQDGLSGSISSEKGEVGILGGSFGTGTVVKGQDKPPVLGKIPGLDFTSEAGKKMIGY